MPDILRHTHKGGAAFSMVPPRRIELLFDAYHASVMTIILRRQLIASKSNLSEGYCKEGGLHFVFDRRKQGLLQGRCGHTNHRTYPLDRR